MAATTTLAIALACFSWDQSCPLKTCCATATKSDSIFPLNPSNICNLYLMSGAAWDVKLSDFPGPLDP